MTQPTAFQCNECHRPFDDGDVFILEWPQLLRDGGDSFETIPVGRSTYVCLNCYNND